MLGIVDFFEFDGSVYIVTKYEAGGDLVDYAEARGKAHLSEKQTQQLFVQLALGLKDIHIEQIVHRDIKHKNIFLNSHGKNLQVRIADFGLACYLENDECFVQDSGTLGYKSPEMVLKQPSDFKCDVWSLGVMTYELLCGEMPFKGSSSKQVDEAILTKDLRFKGKIWAGVSE